MSESVFLYHGDCKMGEWPNILEVFLQFLLIVRHWHVGHKITPFIKDMREIQFPRQIFMSIVQYILNVQGTHTQMHNLPLGIVYQSINFHFWYRFQVATKCVPLILSEYKKKGIYIYNNEYKTSSANIVHASLSYILNSKICFPHLALRMTEYATNIV